MKGFKKALLLSALSFLNLEAADLAVQDINFADIKDRPWFCGPLLTPSGYIVNKGHLNFEPYYYAAFFTSRYDKNWKKVKEPTGVVHTFFTPLRVGLGHGLDASIAPSLVSRYKEGASSTHLGDTAVGLSIRLRNAELKDPWPAVRLSYRCILPTGRYRNLSPKKNNTDASGEGAYFQVLGLAATKLWHLSDFHYFEFRLAASAFFAPPVHVRGLSFYSPEIPLKAKVYNGVLYAFFSSVQANLSRHIALACDLLYKHKNRNRLKTANGYIKRPSNENFSIAPSIQYNFTQDIGIIGGVWFSVAGRNSYSFTQGVFALNIYH